ncbi:transporter [Rhizobium sp. RCAM05350]|nr:transporter [Rhizobium sp. RCAM05350]
MRNRKIPGLVAALASLLAAGSVSSVYAAEGGAGFYLLGSKGPAAAILPPPGVFFQNDVYYYQGDLGGDRQLPLGGKLVGAVDASVVVELPTFIWVTPWDPAGGNFALTTTLPIGWKDVAAKEDLASPLGPVSRSVSDDVFTVGDPIVSGLVGWHSGDFHWQTGVLVNVPIGDYQKGALANIAFNHWGSDVFAAGTWFNPETGIDISGTVGIAFNVENPATDYRTGNEFHFEWAVSKHFTEQFSAGIVGYHYSQLTGDSGSGAKLGDFKGRVTALGAQIGYNFKVGEQAFATSLKVFQEFDAKNRAEGTAVFATVSVPISITPPAP